MRPFTISTICGCSNGSPPGRETMGAPHSSTAAKHSSGDSCFFKICGGYCTLPHPAHARLQRKSGSSISTSGYFLLPLSRCFHTYVATVHTWEIGIAIFSLPSSAHQGALHSPAVSGQCQQREVLTIQVIRQVKNSREASSSVQCLTCRSIPCSLVPAAIRQLTS